LKHREAEPVTITKVLPRSDANFMWPELFGKTA
jgi:hypothetical protein